MLRAIRCLSVIVLLSGLAFGQSTVKPLTFDVADVHTSKSSIIPQMSGGNLRGTRYEIRNASMVDLIKTAYGVDDDKVVGGPAWLGSDRFDVIAKAPAGATAETAKTMLQNLLADRFKLAVHNDTKPLPVYVLTVGKNGSKLKASTSTDTGCKGQPQPPPAPGAIPPGVVSCHNLTSAQIADNFRQMAPGYLDHPVIDSTKLEGSWDFDIKWTGRGQLAAAGSDGISFFDAVDKQLGLKLELQKIAMPIIAVDSVNQKPSDNLPGVGESLPAEAPVEFEAAVIKPSAPDSPQQGVGFRYSPGGRIDGVGSLKDLVAVAMEIPPNLSNDLLVGLPKFASTTRYDIVAKTPSTGIGAPDRTGGRDVPPPISVALMMLRTLMEDQFGLKAHKEDQQATSYAILVPKGEPKLKKADPSERAGCKPDPGAAPVNGNPTPMIAYTCQNTTIADLAKNVEQWAPAYIDHPVVDTSGLQGGWDFTLYWTPRGNLQGAPRPAGSGSDVVSALDPGGLSVFEAMEKELGLKLEVGKHMVSVTVVDHLEEKPKN
jgi:uncharacterized protein (TIGR03435 family)